MHNNKTIAKQLPTASNIRNTLVQHASNLIIKHLPVNIFRFLRSTKNSSNLCKHLRGTAQLSNLYAILVGVHTVVSS